MSWIFYYGVQEEKESIIGMLNVHIDGIDFYQLIKKRSFILKKSVIY
jgi:hypothetical protein